MDSRFRSSRYCPTSICQKKEKKLAGPLGSRKEAKHGGKMCKIAKKGKGRAYGKNS